MAKREEMTITIDEAGNISVDLDGIVGTGCHAIQEAMSNAIGVTTKEVKKADYYKKATVKQTVQNRG